FTGKLRPRDHRRRNQWRRDRARCRDARPERRAGRARRLCRRDLLALLQADSWRIALPPAGRTPPGAYGARRARAFVAGDRAASGQATAVSLPALPRTGPRPNRPGRGTVVLRPVRAHAARRAPSPR